MSENTVKATVLLLSGVLLLSYLLIEQPAYLASSSSLAIFVGAEILLAAVLKYRQAFFPILICVFVFAGTAVPAQSAFLQARWIVLGVGAIAGLAVYMKDRDHHFSTIHLLAFFCVLSAAISATVSQYPGESRLKVGSLFLLLLYASAGARTAIPRFRPEIFFQRMLLGCEAVTYISAVLYLVFHIAFFGNPNSLGAVMGVVVVPVLVWGILTSPPSPRRVRLAIALGLAALLLISSFSRASIGAATIAFLFLCVGARRYRLLVKGMAGAVVIAMLVLLFLPRSIHGPNIEDSDSLGSAFLYKGHKDGGMFESRKSVWRETWQSIRENTWFGTGFGTSRINEDMTKLQYASHHIDSWVVREHGNSYLAIIEWSGLLGVIPFYALVAMTAANVLRVFAWLRHTGQILSPAALLAATVSAGLVHAMFEDWMFAVGYYICLIFWVNAFLLVDMLPRPATIYSPVIISPYQQRGFAAASGQ